jgi:hypothetical protein
MIRKTILKFIIFYFISVFLFQTGCATNSINRDNNIKNPIVKNVTKFKDKNKHSNKNARRTLSGHGKVADDSFLNVK